MVSIDFFVVVKELRRHACESYHRSCQEAEPESTFAANMELMFGFLPGHTGGTGFHGGETVAVKPLSPPLLTLREGVDVLFA